MYCILFTDPPYLASQAASTGSQSASGQHNVTLLGQNGVPTQSYAFLPVVPGLRAWATRSGTYAATMVRECKKFGMKPVCDDPSLCANDANALYIGHNGSLARQQSGPLGFIEVAHLWSARCSYGGTGPSFAYSGTIPSLCTRFTRAGIEWRRSTYMPV